MKNILSRLWEVICKGFIILLLILYCFLGITPVFLYMPFEIIGIVFESTVFNLLLYIFTGLSHYYLVNDVVYKNVSDKPLFITSYPLHFYIELYYKPIELLELTYKNIK